MVWCAATLWAETSDGYFRERWHQALRARGVASATLELSRTSGTSSPIRRSNSAQPTGGEVSWSDSDGSPSPRDQIAKSQRARRLEESRRQQLEERLTQDEQEHDARGQMLRSNRMAALRLRRLQRDEHTRAVKVAALQREGEKVQRARESLRQRERRFLPVMDQCETQEECDVLRAAAFQNALCCFLFTTRSRRAIAVFHAMEVFRKLFWPLMRARRARRRRIALTYAGLWRGKCPRPTVAVLKSVMPALVSWTAAAVQKLIRCLRPTFLPPGRRVFSMGEPGAAALYVSSGRVAVRQPRLHAVDLELGERGASYLHGEELLLKDQQVTHFTHLTTLEPMYAWYLPRRWFLDVRRDSQSQGDLLTVSHVMTSLNQSRTEEYVNQALESSKLLLNGWSRTELTQMIESAPERTVERGSSLYLVGDRAIAAYLVIRGTIVIAQRCKRVGKSKHASALGDNLDAHEAGAASAIHHHQHHDGVSPAPSGGPDYLTIVFGKDGTSGVGAPARSAVRLNRLTMADIEDETFVKEYCNAGQIVGADALLFGTVRTEYAFAASDAVLLELRHKTFVDGMFTDPLHLLKVKATLNKQRAGRLVAPSAEDLQGLFCNPVHTTFFLRHMTPVVASRGEALPLRSCIVFLQEGSVTMEGVTFRAPTLLLNSEALTAVVRGFTRALSNGQLELIRADRDPTRGSFVGGAILGGEGGDHGGGAERGARGPGESRRNRVTSKASGAGPPKTRSAATTGANSISTGPSVAPVQPIPEASGASVSADQSEVPGGTETTSAPAAEHGGGGVGSAATAGGMPESTECTGTTADSPHPAVDLSSIGVASPNVDAPELWGYLPLPGAPTLVVKHPLNRDAVNPEEEGVGRQKYRHLPYALRMEILCEELLEGCQAMHRCNSRVDAWVVRHVDFLRKFAGSGVPCKTLADFVTGSLLEQLSPPSRE